MVVHSVCALDCPDACSLLVTVDELTGRAVKLRGNPEHPITRGFLCAKVAKYLDREYSPARLLYPLRRTGPKGAGQFARITWDEALDEIATRLGDAAREYGGESILPYSYAGTMGILQFGSMDRRFFHRLGASRLDRTICSTAGMAGSARVLGDRYSTEPEQFAHSRLIVAWGANILGTSVHLWPFIVEARRRGARFYTIDPVRNRTGQLADKHFFIRPGTDLALALGLAHVIIGENLHDADYVARYTNGFAELQARAAEYPPERTEALTGIPRADIVALARELATTQPAAIRLNYGVQRSERGGAAVSAITALGALTGSWRHLGGGVSLSTSHAYRFNADAVERPDLQPGGPKRLVNMTRMGHALTELHDPPVQALFVYNSNPASIAPRQNTVLAGLSRPDLFTVVAEQFQTCTADYADIVLPATTFLEHKDIYRSYGHYYIQLAGAAVAPPGECRSNTNLFRALAARMGLNDPCFADTDDDLIDQALSSGHAFLDGIGRARLEREHSVRLNVAPPGEPFRPFAAGGFGTPSGKCELAPPDFVPPFESRLGDPSLTGRFPLEMISPKNDDSMNSTFGYLPARDAETARLALHPADAAARAIADGDAVRIFNDRGELRLTARLTPDIVPGVVSCPSTRWQKLAADRRNANVLVSDRLTDMGGGPVFYSTLVQVERTAVL
ncbi:MAG: molybdopterin-dependent oxidoreductase [Bryobacterales bacterium]|nr:molybdopterin-dependent oxidoreductase [Bryobacterales bacterium]